MKTCIKCGGNAYRDADTYCAHDFGEAPEPTNVMRYYAPEHREMLWWAQDKGCPGASHPTREGAIALWKERWLWGHALVALFRWLLALPPITRGMLDASAIEALRKCARAVVEKSEVCETDPTSVTIRLYAPEAVLAEAERSAVIARATAEARRRFGDGGNHG